VSSVKYRVQIHILDTPRCRPNRAVEPVLVLVPESFAAAVDTHVLDRLGIVYRTQEIPSSVFWYRSYQPPLGTSQRWSVSFLTEPWQTLMPVLYHAGFDAGYSSPWPTVGWRKPNRDIATVGSIYLTDVEGFSGSLWGQLAAGTPVEPVQASVRSSLRRWGFELYLAGDPPEDSVGRAEWLLNSDTQIGTDILDQRRDRARLLIQAALTDLFQDPVPIWAGHLRQLQQEIRCHAQRWGFSVPKV
jgi:hypothetical protein